MTTLSQYIPVFRLVFQGAKCWEWLMITGPGLHSVDHLIARKLGVAKGASD